MIADYMSTGGWSTGCWVLLGLLRITDSSNMNCISLEFDGLRSSDQWIEIKENSYINLTANLQWTPGCERNSKDRIQLKITYPEGSFSIDVCKLILTTNCDESDTSNATSVCRCLNKNSVQFYKKFSRFDSRNYTWTWVNLRNTSTEKRKEIFISVITMSSEERSSIPWITASTCAFVGVVVVVAVGFILWKRKIVFCCQEYSSSPPGVDTECRDNNEETRQVDGSVYTDIKDVQDDDMSHPHDPSYVYIKEEMNHPGQRKYAYIRKQDKSRAHNSTYLHPVQEGIIQQEDLTYDHLRALR